jgi:hypothetical protein
MLFFEPVNNSTLLKSIIPSIDGKTLADKLPILYNKIKLFNFQHMYIDNWEYNKYFIYYI